LTDEADLIARIAARDQDAFRLVIAAHARALNTIAYRMMGDAHEAEDIAQEAMLRLWDHAGRFDPHRGVNIGAWLKRVTTNLAIDRLRVAKRAVDGEVPEQADDAPLADARIEADQQTDTARLLLGQLPDRQRAAIVLTYYEEMPNADAAAALDMNIKAFESLLHRARVALRGAYAALDVKGGVA
jgi:RNA polymerase sigma-70 factor (ECF subfamily)